MVPNWYKSHSVNSPLWSDGILGWLCGTREFTQDLTPCHMQRTQEQWSRCKNIKCKIGQLKVRKSSLGRAISTAFRLPALFVRADYASNWKALIRIAKLGNAFSEVLGRPFRLHAIDPSCIRIRVDRMQAPCVFSQATEGTSPPSAPSPSSESLS